jgi:crotonobetainyl-CoA:carnitine CoA-transferase CaiB-like acyl-CoA transferase
LLSVPCGKFNTREEMFADPQIAHNKTLESHEHPTLGKWVNPRPPATFSKTPSKVQGVPATMGEHTVEALRGFGMDEETIAELQADGIVGGGGA